MSDQQPPTPPQPEEPPTDPQQPMGQQPAQQPGQPYGQQPGQPYGQQPPGAPPPPAYGGQPAPLRPDEERTWTALAHFGAIVIGFLAPMLVYLMYKDRSQWVAEQSREALNFNLSYLIYIIIAALSLIVLVGLILLPVVIVMYYVFLIIGGVKALNGELYRYPLIIRMVS